MQENEGALAGCGVLGGDHVLSPARQSRIQAVDHVHIDVHADAVTKTRWFYREAAELEEVTGHDPSSERLCFCSEGIELHLAILNEPQVDGVAVRLTIAVSSLDRLMELLREHRFPVERITGLLGSDLRVHTLDPTGHRVEFIQEPRGTIF